MLKENENIILVGFMGSGKTTIGKKLAKKLGKTFLDMDHAIEQQEGKSISQIFKENGEAYFRQLETQFILSLKPNSNLVISTGGGAPCFNNNMEKLNGIGTSVYLKVPSKMLTDRLYNRSGERPLIENSTKDELYKYVSQKLSEREVYYLQAKIVYLNVKSTINDLESKLETNLD